MTISSQEVYDSLRNDMIGGKSFVIHRENIAGKTQIHKFKLQDQQVISYELPHIVENIICLDFNSFYGSCISSEQYPLIPYTNHKMYMPGGVKAHIEGNKGEELKNKLEVNTSFGYDSINSEKYKDFRLCNKKNVWKHHIANTFLTDKQISENCFIVELEKKRCSCSTPLQVAYFTMDNSKYFYLNAYYNFLTPCLDMDYIHVSYCDTD
ncbi:MAG: hypothetical protein EZS28_043495, partial [Streblomastix strix]